MRFHYYYLVICLFSLYLGSCSTSKSIERNNSPKKSLSKYPITTTELSIQELINHQLDTSKVLQNAFSGIYIVDLSNDAILFESNQSKLFTPASNTKILSCLAGLKYLNDSIPYFKYIEREDSLILKGIGSPVLIHPYLDSLSLGTKFLKEQSRDIYLDLNGSIAQKYGPGWAWDDYLYAYQSEKSAFPIYGNMINIKKEKTKDELLISPPYFNKYIQADSSIDKTIVRSELKNQLIFNPQLIKGKSFEKFIPFISSNELSVQLLSKAIDKEVSLVEQTIHSNEWQVLNACSRTDLLSFIMNTSDNFAAEQILLMISEYLLGSIDDQKILDTLTISLDLNHNSKIRWVDGSGLSRYNLLSPKILVKTLDSIKAMLTLDEIKMIFPKIENPYKLDIYAKTGTLSNNRCLSGYLISEQKTLIAFSIMINHHTSSLKNIDSVIFKILHFIASKN